MTIQNPILRFLSSFAVLAPLLAAGMVFLYGIGNLMQPWYAQAHPTLYGYFGYSSFTTFGVHGILALVVLAIMATFLSSEGAGEDA